MITDNEQLASASECQCGSEALERYACKATQNIMIHGAECCTIAELVGLENSVFLKFLLRRQPASAY